MGTKFLTIILAILVVMSIAVYAGDEVKYVGSKKCKTCHNADKNGGQYKLWSSRAHAKSYESLTSESAKKKAKEAGIEDPLKSDNCLSCHTTAHGKKNIDKSYKIEEGVGCESCHGPGSKYKKMSTMKNKEKSVAAGLTIVDEKTCINCHKKDTPGHEGKFTTFEKEYAKIAHPVPPENDRRTKKKK